MPEVENSLVDEARNELVQRLFVEEYSSMCRFANAILGDQGLAETAAQEAFVAALRFHEKLAASENPTGWLYNTLRNVIKHLQRERSKLLIHTVPLDEINEQEAARVDEYSLLDDKLKASKDMKLLVDFYYMGYSIQELADRYEISVGACKMRIKRAKQRIRKELE